MARFDMTFFDSILVDQKMMDLEEAIHKILHPNIPYSYKDFCHLKGVEVSEDLSGDWKNAICDTQSMWCHIHYKGDIFVSGDKNYRKKTKIPKLQQLGAKRIVTPESALILLNSVT
jgi:hypothetical protein